MRGRKPNISQTLNQIFNVFIKQSCFAVSATHYFALKIPNQREFQQVAFNHLSNIDFQGFINLCKKCTA